VDADPAYAATLAFEDGISRARADRAEPFDLGVAILTPSLPIVHDLNQLQVRRPGAAVTAPALMAAADRLLGGAGLRHRCVSLAGFAPERGVHSAFAGAGWPASELVTMALRRPPDRPAGGAPRAEPVTLDDLDAVRAASLREHASGIDELVDQIAQADLRFLDASDARFFGVRGPGGGVIAGCHLYSDGRAAQIEDVATLPEHRGRGAARAVISAAIATAQAAGHELIFIVAEAEGWPRHFYGRLGFDPIGRRTTWTLPAD
jgi:GNAT superfamily N-acetyltransferase